MLLMFRPAPEVSKVPSTPDPSDTATVESNEASDLAPWLTLASATAWFTNEVPK